MDALLELKRVSREFAVRRGFFDPRPASVKAVNEVSFQLSAGETLGLVGESGCGKSTLARMAVGLLSPSSGEVLLSGRPIGAWSPLERASRIQMIFQDPFSSLDPRQSVGSSIAEPLRLAAQAAGRPLSRAEWREKVQEILVHVGLQPEHIDRYPHEFSGGQRQRVAVARAIVARPGAVVCDEPVSALDASVQAQVLNLLKDMQQNMGLGYLFISHDLGVIGFMSDRVAVMYLGRLVEMASCDELFFPCRASLHGSAHGRRAVAGSVPPRPGRDSFRRNAESAFSACRMRLPSPLPARKTAVPGRRASACCRQPRACRALPLPPVRTA